MRRRVQHGPRFPRPISPTTPLPSPHHRHYHRRYHDARLQFIKSNEQLEIDFPFNLYLKACVRQLFVQLIHIHWGIWVAVCVLIQIHLLLQTTFDSAFRSGGSDDGNVTLLTEGDDGQGVELGLSMLDYMLICAVGLIVWLIVVYLKVVHVQVRDAALRPTASASTSPSPPPSPSRLPPSIVSRVQSCIFRSDMLNFNVVAEIMWEVYHGSLTPLVTSR